jgi:membrane-associated phospholipid phosphatase
MKALFYDWGGLNVWLFQTINAWHNDVLDHVMLLGTFLAEHANFPFYIAAMAIIALRVTARGDRRDTFVWMTVVAVFALGNLVDGWVVGTLKDAFSFPRPPLALPPGSVHLVGHPELSLQHSLPSGHTSFAMLIAASLWPALRNQGRWLAAIFVVWVGISRVSLGAHFPADVVAGGLSCLVVVVVLRRLLQAVLKIPPR